MVEEENTLEKIRIKLEEVEKLLKSIDSSGREEALKEIHGILSEIRDLLEDVVEEKEGEVDDAVKIIEAAGPLIEKLGSFIKDALKSIMDELSRSLDGKKLAEDIAALYQGLKQAGMPDEVVNEMVKDYYRRRLESVPSLSNLLTSLMKVVGASPPTFTIQQEKKGEKQENK